MIMSHLMAVGVNGRGRVGQAMVSLLCRWFK